jgi:hypothetical protein
VAVNSTVTILIVVVVLLVIALAAVGAMLAKRRRSEHLQEHYDRRAAEAALTEREKRHRSLEIRELEPAERESFENSWVDVQRGFVDDPVQSVRRADALVVDIMRTRGYPVDDFDRQAEDISVEHPQVVQHFRDARATRVATDEGAVDTERQRQAVTSYRALIEALLHGESHQNTTATTTEERTR